MAIYDRDYLTTLPLLHEKANEYSLGDWNKYNDDVGDALLKMVASSSHVVDYYFRRFLTALVLPNDDWNQKTLIWELTGYKPAYLRADYLMVQLYWPDCGLDSFVPIYQYTPFKVNADGKTYTFLCAEDYIIPPLTTRINIRLVNGTLETLDLDYTQINDYKIKLTDDDIDYDLVTVKISGVKWTQVRNVFYSPNTERIFSVHKEEDGTYIYLHSSWKQYVDSYDKSFYIYFVHSLYDFSMYTDDCMTVEFQTELYTIDGDEVSQYYRIVPLLQSDAGADANSLIPSTTEGNRAITTRDFETNALLFPGIASCRAYDWNTPTVCKDPFEVCLIACDSYGNLSNHMKQVLTDYLEAISSPLITVKIIEPIFAKQNILVVLDIGDYKGTLAERQIKMTVQRTLEDFYKIGNLPPGRIVKTKELNSLLLHADSRIYFATTTFINSQVRDPRLIPTLGAVVVITSAETHSAYDFGFHNEFAYIDPHRFDRAEQITEKVSGIELFLSYTLPVNFIVPVDKLPMQLFETPKIDDKLKPIELGAGEMTIADFGISDGFVHVLTQGGSPDIGPVYAFVYETDGTGVFTKVYRSVDTAVTSVLDFDTLSSSIDPGIDTIYITNDNIDQVKDALAKAFNAIPGLVDADGNPFEITGIDIYIPDPEDPDEPEEESVGGAKIMSKTASEGALDEHWTETASELLGTVSDGKNGAILRGSNETTINTYETPNTMASQTVYKAGEIIPEAKYQSDAGQAETREFIYIPYTQNIYREMTHTKESAELRKINFVEQSFTTTDYNNYYDLTYKDTGRYLPNPLAHGSFTFTANTALTIHDTYTEYIPVREDLYTECETFGTQYYVRSTSGEPLHWYFVNTNQVHGVEGTYEIGYGIYVGFNLIRDAAFYVETDPSTTRGFIYSTEMEPGDFSIAHIVD